MSLDELSPVVAQLQHERDTLLIALRLYGQHRPFCQMTQPSLLAAGDGPNRCTCGFREALELGAK